jgi:micrococcal nuclease
MQQSHHGLRNKALIALLIFASGCNMAIAQPQKICDVTKITDGDTINVSCSGVKDKIRFCGIDAPEIKHGRKDGQPYGRDAREFVRKLLDGGKVELVEVERDRYGRMVAELWLGKTFINAEVVRAGLAYDYKQYSKRCPHRDQIVNAEAIAQKNKSGVWDGARDYQLPWDFRKANR